MSVNRNLVKEREQLHCSTIETPQLPWSSCATAVTGWVRHLQYTVAGHVVQCFRMRLPAAIAVSDGLNASCKHRLYLVKLKSCCMPHT